MTSKAEQATKLFDHGFNCAQVVMEVFAKEYGLDPVLARKLGNPLGIGSGMGGECGALTGGFMVLGLEFGMHDLQRPEDAQITFGLMQELADGFKGCHGHTDCPDLLGLDVFTPQGMKAFGERGMKQSHCARYVAEVITRVEAIIARERKAG